MSRDADALVKAMPAVFVLIWSTGFVVARLGMPHAPPLSFLAWRYALSILCLLAWVAVSGARWPRGRAQWLHLGLTGVLIHALYLGGVWSAVKAGMGAGLTALIVGLQPVLTALWTARHGARISPRQWLGLALGFVGLLLVVARKLGQGGEVTPWSLACILAALLGITVGTLYQKRHVQACDVRTANTVQLLGALLVSLPLAWLEREAIDATASFFAAMAWSVLALTLGGSSLLYLLIQRGAATRVTSLMYLVPPTTALLAWLLFDEPITALTLGGTAITAVGVWLVVRSPD